MSRVEGLVSRALERLAVRRPLFQSEADFQLALAWQLQQDEPSAELRLEKRVIDDPRVELDVLSLLDGCRYGLELKFPRSKLDLEVGGERFVLRTGAPDLDRYDVLRDVARLERLVAEGIIDEGCGVVLTNVAGLWQPPSREVPASYDAFRIHEGREVAGTLDWGASAGEGTKTGREHPIVLGDNYHLTWRDYSNVSGVQMRCLLIPVEELSDEPGPVDLLE
jgi:hypothetical protein